MAGKWTVSSVEALVEDWLLAPGDTVDRGSGGDESLVAATAAYEGTGVVMDLTSLPTDTGLRVVS